MAEQLKFENPNQWYDKMLEMGRRLYQRDMIVATEGNFSMRLDDRRIFATPSGVCKGFMDREDLVIIDEMGNHIEGERRASSEIQMHLEVYRQRPDVRAVVHAHPPYCIALMLAGLALDRPILAENVLLLGKVPVAPYARPSTNAVAVSIRPLIRRTDCLLLDHHGSLTAGATLEEAFYKLEMMEHSAKSYLAAQQAGKVRELPREEVQELMALRESRYGIRWPIISYLDD